MSVYSQADLAETRMRLGLKHQLKQIRKGNGYRSDLDTIYDRLPTSKQIEQFPAVVIVFGREAIKNEDQSDQLWHIEQPLVLLVHVNDTDDAVLARESIKWDIITHLGRNPTLPGEDGVETAMSLSYTGSEPFGMILNEPRVGVAVGFKILYRPDILDPSVAS